MFLFYRCGRVRIRSRNPRRHFLGVTTHTLRFSVTSVFMISVCNVIIVDCITIIVESSREIKLMEPLGLDLARFTVGPPGRDSLRV